MLDSLTDDDPIKGVAEMKANTKCGNSDDTKDYQQSVWLSWGNNGSVFIVHMWRDGGKLIANISTKDWSVLSKPPLDFSFTKSIRFLWYKQYYLKEKLLCIFLMCIWMH